MLVVYLHSVVFMPGTEDMHFKFQVSFLVNHVTDASVAVRSVPLHLTNFFAKFFGTFMQIMVKMYNLLV